MTTLAPGQLGTAGFDPWPSASATGQLRLAVRWPVTLGEPAAFGAPTTSTIEARVEIDAASMDGWVLDPAGRRHRCRAAVDRTAGLLHIDGLDDAGDFRLTLTLPPADGSPPRLLYARRPAWMGPPVPGGRTDRPVLG